MSQQNAPVFVAESGGFTADCESVLTRLRIAFGRALNTSPTPILRATDLQRLLGVEASLGWQIFRLAGSDDALGTVAFVPTSGSMSKVLRLMRERGFDAGALGEAAAAYTQFESLVEHHAADRDTFDRMVAGIRGENDDLIEIGDRRAAFRVNTHIWGVQTKVLYRTAIIYPVADPNLCDSASIRGCMGLRQLRPVPSVTLAKRSLISGHRKLEASEMVQPPSSLTLLADYCSRPHPKIELVHGNASSRDTIRIEGIGHDAVLDCFLYDNHVNTGRPWKSETQWGAFISVNLPCELLVCDLLVPSSWSVPSTIVTAVSGNVSDNQSAEDDPESYPLPVTERAVHLGTDLAALHCPAIPRCSELVTNVLGRIGASGTEFDLFRCQIRYPILNSIVLLEVKASPGA